MEGLNMKYLLGKSIAHLYDKLPFSLPSFCSKKFLKRNKAKIVQFVKFLTPAVCLLLYIFCIELPYKRDKAGAELTALITTILGTRLTAVRVLPETNTTRAQPSLECDENLFGLILIKSIPENDSRRNTLRTTWLKFIPTLGVKMKAFFFIGLPADRNITTNLETEMHLYNDIIIEDVDEHDYLLALKSLRLLKWFTTNSKCLVTNYLIKTQDDMFLHIPNLVRYINSVPQSWVNYIGGQLHLNDRVDSNPNSKRYFPTDWWPEGHFPPFVGAGLTVLSSEVVPQLLNASLNVPLTHLEDVYLTGIVGFNKLQLVPSDIPGIEYNNPKWFVRLKMALSFQDMSKTYIAFHAPDDMEFIVELYNQATI